MKSSFRDAEFLDHLKERVRSFGDKMRIRWRLTDDDGNLTPGGEGDKIRLPIADFAQRMRERITASGFVEHMRERGDRVRGRIHGRLLRNVDTDEDDDDEPLEVVYYYYYYYYYYYFACGKSPFCFFFWGAFSWSSSFYVCPQGPCFGSGCDDKKNIYLKKKK